MPTYTRVRDTKTGHTFDVGERRLAVLLKNKAVEVMPDYPNVSGPGARPRRAKHFVDKAGRPATPSTTPDPASAEPADSEGEKS